jgi:hypothetical protein
MEHKEDLLQKNCVKWFKLQYPNILIHHSPNGGKRTQKVNKYGQKYSPEAAKFKAMGTLAGFPDIFVPKPIGIYHGLFIELKTGKNYLTENQKTVMEKLIDNGYFVKPCYTFDDFKLTVERYFNL